MRRSLVFQLSCGDLNTVRRCNGRAGETEHYALQIRIRQRYAVRWKNWLLRLRNKSALQNHPARRLPANSIASAFKRGSWTPLGERSIRKTDQMPQQWSRP